MLTISKKSYKHTCTHTRRNYRIQKIKRMKTSSYLNFAETQKAYPFKTFNYPLRQLFRPLRTGISKGRMKSSLVPPSDAVGSLLVCPSTIVSITPAKIPGCEETSGRSSRKWINTIYKIPFVLIGRTQRKHSCSITISKFAGGKVDALTCSALGAKWCRVSPHPAHRWD